LSNRGYTLGQGWAEEYPNWVAARQDWANKNNDGYPHMSWLGVPMAANTSKAAWCSAGIDAIWQRRQARRANMLG
jgi:hypothetical protein